MIEITIYQHSRPEVSFGTISEAALYLWPDDEAARHNASDELDSFHETENRSRNLMAKRTDPLAYIPTDEAGMREWYEETVGYDPMDDDPSMTAEELRKLVQGYAIEAAYEAA